MTKDNKDIKTNNTGMAAKIAAAAFIFSQPAAATAVEGCFRPEFASPTNYEGELVGWGKRCWIDKENPRRR